MVQAILEGSKSQTRRKVKERHHPVRDEVIRGERMLCPSGWPLLYEREFLQRFCPYGQVGDVLWVREEHYAFGHWEKNGQTASGRQKWRFIRSDDPTFGIFFFDTKPEGLRIKPNNYRGMGWYKRLARFMPREYTRLFLQITDIRVERLQDISEADALSEGIDTSKLSGDHEHTPVQEFEELWRSINGPYSWSDNPWVWVVSFEQIDRPADFLTHKAPKK